MWRHRREDSTSGRVSEETVRKRNFLYCSIYPIEDVPIPSLSVIPLKQQKKLAPGRKGSFSAMVTSLLLDTSVLDTSGRKVKWQEHLEVIFFSYVHNCLWWDTKLPGKGVERLRAQLPSQQVLRHQESWGFHLPRCQSSALLPRSSWGGSRAWAGGSGSCAWWLQACVVAPSPCQHLPPPPGSPRCFSWSSVPNAVTVWKQTGRTPSPLGTGYVARRDMLVAGCLHHLEALLNHLTANFVALSSTEEKKPRYTAPGQ